MSTIPFRRVEMSIALPSAEVFSRMPATFGHEWVLRLPTIEISALYAAVSRTFCLSAEMFRSVCRWDRGRVDLHCMVAKSVADTVAHAAAPGNMPVPEVSAIQDPPRADSDSPRHPSWITALSACAVGGSVLLAWLIAQHMPRHAVAPPVQHAQALNSAHFASAPVDARGVQTAMPNQVRRAVVSEPRTRTHKHVARVGTEAVTKRRAGVSYPHAGSHSPRHAATVPGNDYGSVAMFANTYTNESRPVTAVVLTDSTDMPAHLTQRRLTEIPDQFSK
jgi:hypothetical protein